MKNCDELNMCMNFTYWASISCIFVVITRMSEPMIKKAAKEFFCEPFRIRKVSYRPQLKRKRTSWKERKYEGTLCSFLGCSAKTQYVYVILEAVNFVLKEQQIQLELTIDLKRENR